MDGIFINDDDVFVIKVYIAKNTRDNSFIADLNKTKMIETYGTDIEIDKIEEHELVFKQAGFGDKTDILSKTTRVTSSSEGNISLSLDVVTARYSAMGQLLKSWTFKDKEGNPIPTTEENLRKLNPFIGAVIAMEFDAKTGGFF